MRVRIRRFRDLSPRGPEVRFAFRRWRLRRPQVAFGLHPILPRQAPPQRIGWRMAIHESRALLPTITVRAFVRCRTTMPSADFCCKIKAPCGAFSHESATHSRSPEVSSTAFRTQPPNLQPVPLMNMGFAVIGQLARHHMPQIRFLYIGSSVCSTLLSDPPVTGTPLRFAITSPPSGCEKDFHLRAVEHARHTKKGASEKAPFSIAGGSCGEA